MPKNFCQNPLCHLEDTKDRIKKGVYQTRKSNSGFWNYFCTQRCFHQYFNIFKNRIIEHIGLTTTPNTRPLVVACSIRQKYLSFALLTIHL